jgi:hypothetical protein
MVRKSRSPEEEWVAARGRLLRSLRFALVCALVAGAIAGAVSGGLQGAVEFAAALALLTLIPVGIVYAMAYDRLSPEGRLGRDRETRDR